MSQPSVSPTKGWGSVPTAAPCSFTDVMSEELAKKIEADETEAFSPWTPPDDDLTKTCAGASGGKDEDDAALAAALAASEAESTNTDNDLLMAQLLQHEFDREADTVLRKAENKYNGDSKVSLSFANFRQLHPRQHDEETYGDEDEEEEEEDWRHTSKSSGVRINKRRGYNRSGANGETITTKHDAVLCGRANTARSIDMFASEIAFGDGEAFDLKLPNRAYNDLRAHATQEARRAARLHEKKDHSTATQAIDPKTKLLLFKLVGSGLLEEVNGVVSSGKESVVLHALGGEMEGKEIPSECAIKVFKTSLTSFRNRETYVRGDVRFNKDPFKKQSSKKVMKIWAEKEVMNLSRMRRAGICCPKPVVLKQHALVMEFVGRDGVAAPKLKVADLSPKQLAAAYEQCVAGVETMYQQCGLVHGDLSEYNTLWHDGKVWFIDTSTACELSNPSAYEFLLRDCRNVVKFFRDAGVPDVMSEYELFNRVTKLDLQGEGEEFLLQMQEYEKTEMFISLDQQRRDFAFDYLFDKAKGGVCLSSEDGEGSASKEEMESDECEVEEQNEDSYDVEGKGETALGLQKEGCAVKEKPPNHEEI